MARRKEECVTNEQILNHFRRFGVNGLTTAKLVSSLGISPHSVLDRLRRCKEIVCSKPDGRINLWKLRSRNES